MAYMNEVPFKVSIICLEEKGIELVKDEISIIKPLVLTVRLIEINSPSIFVILHFLWFFVSIDILVCIGVCP